MKENFKEIHLIVNNIVYKILVHFIGMMVENILENGEMVEKKVKDN